MRLNILGTVISASAVLSLLAGCGKSAAQLEAEQHALDADVTVVSACTSDALDKVAIPSLTWEESTAVCDKMAKTMGRNPSVKLFRHLSKAVSAMNVQGRGGDPADNAYQFMRIVENRGELNSDERMYATFDIVFKIMGGSDGRVMPKDLNIFLSSMGRGARTMSDEGLLNSGAMLSVMKQDQGQ